MSDTIYVELLYEGVDVWRPVEAENLGNATYRLIAPADYDAAIEEWQFKPGTLVRCEMRLLRDGPTLVAISEVEGFDQ